MQRIALSVRLNTRPPDLFAGFIRCMLTDKLGEMLYKNSSAVEYHPNETWREYGLVWHFSVEGGLDVDHKHMSEALIEEIRRITDGKWKGMDVDSLTITSVRVRQIHQESENP